MQIIFSLLTLFPTSSPSLPVFVSLHMKGIEQSCNKTLLEYPIQDEYSIQDWHIECSVSPNTCDILLHALSLHAPSHDRVSKTWEMLFWPHSIWPPVLQAWNKSWGDRFRGSLALTPLSLFQAGPS